MSRRRPKERKFLDAWLDDDEFKDWIRKADDGESVYCTYCNCLIRPRKDGLTEHMRSAKHIKHSQSGVEHSYSEESAPKERRTYKRKQQDLDPEELQSSANTVRVTPSTVSPSRDLSMIKQLAAAKNNNDFDEAAIFSQFVALKLRKLSADLMSAVQVDIIRLLSMAERGLEWSVIEGHVESIQQMERLVNHESSTNNNA